jgi:hypothetical protein
MTDASSQSGRLVSREEFEQEVLQRARRDRGFRDQLLASPTDALKATFGLELPPGVEIQVLQETISRFYLVLPVNVEELTDEQLAAVAGGGGSLAAHYAPLEASIGMQKSGLLWSPSATFRVK